MSLHSWLIKNSENGCQHSAVKCLIWKWLQSFSKFKCQCGALMIRIVLMMLEDMVKCFFQDSFLDKGNMECYWPYCAGIYVSRYKELMAKCIPNFDRWKLTRTISFWSFICHWKYYCTRSIVTKYQLKRRGSYDQVYICTSFWPWERPRSAFWEGLLKDGHWRSHAIPHWCFLPKTAVQTNDNTIYYMISKQRLQKTERKLFTIYILKMWLNLFARPASIILQSEWINLISLHKW